MLNAFDKGFKQIELIIESKPFEYSNDVKVYLTQHHIFLIAHSHKQILFRREAPWSYKF